MNSKEISKAAQALGSRGGRARAQKLTSEEIKKISAAAAKLGRKGGRVKSDAKKAAAKKRKNLGNLTPSQRSEIARKAANARWANVRWAKKKLTEKEEK